MTEGNMPAITSIQILLIGVILVLTALLVFIGSQVIFILRELHGAAKKLNGKEQVSPNLFSLVKQAKNASQNTDTQIPINKFVSSEMNTFSLPTIRENGLENEIELNEHIFSHISAIQERGRQITPAAARRVFHRSGKPLA